MDARFHAMSFWRGMVKRSRATERKEKREGRESRRGADWGREGGKKVFAEVVLDESKPPSVFSPRPLLIARFIRAEKPFLDHVPTFLLSAHPCPSTLPFIINCFVRSLLCETSFKSGSSETPSEKYIHPRRNLIWIERFWKKLGSRISFGFGLGVLLV